MTNRRIVVEAAFGKTYRDTITSGDWVQLVRPDGRTRAMAAAWTIGRDNEFDHFPPGTAEVVLWDRDRELDPDNPGSSYAGLLLPLTPVRIRSQDVDTLAYTDEFYGYVQNGWERVLAPKETGNCRIELIDLLGVVSGRKLPDVFDHAVLDLDPVGYWVLDVGTEEVPDRAGDEDGLLVGSVNTGGVPVLPGDRESVEFSPGNEFTAEAGEEVLPARVEVTRSPLITDPRDITWVATFKARRGAHTSTNARVLVALTNGNGSGAGTGAFAYITPDRKMRYTWVINGSGITYETDGPVTYDGHVFIGNEDGLAVDTGVLTTSTTTGVALHPIGISLGGGRGLAAVQHWDGWIGAAALYDYALNQTQRQSIVDAANRLAGETTDAVIDWVLDRVGVPAGLRDLDDGTVVMPAVLTYERDALEVLHEVVATEGGNLYVDHRNGGKIRFRNRYRHYLASRSTTSQATFSDDPDVTGVIRYPAEGLEVATNGLDGIVNEVTATWGQAGQSEQVIVRDDDSIEDYGPRSHQIDTIGPKALAQSAAQWLIARYKDPRTRIRAVTASRRTTYSRDDNVQALELHDRVTVRVRPLHTGAATEAELYVDGITNEVQGVTWVTSFRFAQTPGFTPWIWGTSAWGIDTIWG